MTGTLNKVILIGRLGGNPDVSTTNSGKSFARFSIATDYKVRDDNSNWSTSTDWHKVVVWSQKLVEIIERYAKKGNLVYVEGRLKTRKWEGQDGQPRYTTEVVLSDFNAIFKFLGSSNQQGKQQDDSESSFGSAQSGRSAASASGMSDEMLDDEIPF